MGLVFPHDLWEEIKRLIPSGERSRVITEAAEREIRRRQKLEALERVPALGSALRQKYGEMPGCVEDIRHIRCLGDYQQ